jgi:hypothetical protein
MRAWCLVRVDCVFGSCAVCVSVPMHHTTPPLHTTHYILPTTHHFSRPGEVLSSRQQRAAMERKWADVSDDLKRVQKEKGHLQEHVVELEQVRHLFIHTLMNIYNTLTISLSHTHTLTHSQVQLSFRDKIESKQRELKFLQETTESRVEVCMCVV